MHSNNCFTFAKTSSQSITRALRAVYIAQCLANRDFQSTQVVMQCVKSNRKELYCSYTSTAITCTATQPISVCISYSMDLHCNLATTLCH